MTKSTKSPSLPGPLWNLLQTHFLKLSKLSRVLGIKQLQFFYENFVEHIHKVNQKKKQTRETWKVPRSVIASEVKRSAAIQDKSVFISIIILFS